jgi:hypothetical protein
MKTKRGSSHRQSLKYKCPFRQKPYAEFCKNFDGLGRIDGQALWCGMILFMQKSGHFQIG